MSTPNNINPYESGRFGGQPPAGYVPQTEGDATGGIIPYKNPAALIAYYLGIFSILPCIGILLAVPALILGIIGLQQRNKNPAIKGSVHAWIGIVMGGLMTVLWSVCIGLMVFAAARQGP
jgi:uncharacterized protein YqgC (DUF456 family)